MIPKILSCWLFLGLAISLAAAPKTLEEQLARDNPKMIAYLQALTPEQKNKVLKGVKLSDGTVELDGAVFVGSKYVAAKKQHFYLFKEDGAYRAYAWIDSGGSDLVIPKDKTGSVGEDAAVLSGDVFTFTKLTSKDGVVILYGATPEWLAKQS